MSIHLKAMIVFVALFAMTAILSLIVLPSGQIDYGYIEPYTVGSGIRVFMTRGHRSYRPDRELYVGQSFDEAADVAKKLDCTLK